MEATLRRVNLLILLRTPLLRLDLLGGSYAPRSPLGGVEKCVNLFPEIGKPGRAGMVQYQRPGLRQLTVPPSPGRGRGIFRASNGVGYCVAGRNVYRIEPNSSLTLVGTLSFDSSFLCSFRDNGLSGLLVDNSGFGYTWDIQTGGGFKQVSDSTNTFKGGTKVDFLDGYLIWNLPGSNEYGCTLNNQLVFNGTLVGVKDGYPDYIQSLIVNRREILLLGSVRSEIHYNAGNPLFPFAILPGAYIEWGCVAPYSVAATDVDVFWLGQGESGTGVVLRQRGYSTTVVSNPALSYALQQLDTLTDAVGYTYTRDGHLFYVLTFPSGDQTWVYDMTIPEPHLAWHQRSFVDGDGAFHRDRVISQAWVNGLNIGQDWQNGTLYVLDPDYFGDFVDEGNGQGAFLRPITYLRSVSPIGDPKWDQALDDGKAIMLRGVFADFECGQGELGPNSEPPQLGLRVSFDRGKTFGQNLLQSTAEFDNQGHVIEASNRLLPQWRGLGLGRWPVFEFSWSYFGKASISGLWVDVEKTRN